MINASEVENLAEPPDFWKKWKKERPDPKDIFEPESPLPLTPQKPIVPPTKSIDALLQEILTRLKKLQEDVTEIKRRLPK